MKKTLGILVATIVALILFQDCQKSEFLVVTGIVRDSITNEPIEGANIVTSDGRFYETASDGTFTMDGLQPGMVEFQVICHNNQGYFSSTKKAIITSGRVNKIDFTLSPVPKPNIETGQATNITKTSASITGNIKLEPGTSITHYGHCWSDSEILPTIVKSSGRTSFPGSGTEFSFTSQLTGLKSEAIYYVRSYVLSNAGIIYGNTITFRTSEILDINQGLIAYYPFNGNYLDESGQGYSWLWADWTWPPFVNDRFGNNNSACRYSNMVDTYGPFTYPGFNDFSVSLWFYKDSWENEIQYLLAIGEGGSNRFYFGQGTAPNAFYCGIRVNAVHYRVVLNVAPPVNTWHHVVAKRQGNTLSMYVDGVLKGSTNCPADYLPTSDLIDIGCGWISGYTKFVGDIDDVRIYNRTLSVEEIQYLNTH